MIRAVCRASAAHAHPDLSPCRRAPLARCASGLTVGQRNRGDVLFEQYPQAVRMPGITLRGLL